jgi:dynein heavy chain
MNREEANQLKVTQLNDRLFRSHLEDCLAFGKPILIENIEEELDPLLDPVLERRVIKKVGGVRVCARLCACVCACV